MDIVGGELTQTNGNPIWPGAQSTGPLTAGNVPHGDGVSALAGAGEYIGGAGNAGYVSMGQFSAPISQAAASAVGGVTTRIVIPAQSMIQQMLLYVTTAFTGGTTTSGVTDTAGASYTATTTIAGASIGVIAVAVPATASIVQKWQNVGSTDVQLVLTAGGTGNGQCVLYVRYLQGCNSAQST
jgi:hypothetical protein